MEKRFKGTQDVAHKSINGKLVFKEDNSYVIAEFSKEEDTELFVDALTTIQKCGLMPSEIKEQRDELFKAIIDIYDELVDKNNIKSKTAIETNVRIQELINKIK